MDLNTLSTWVEIVAATVTLIAGLVAGLWAYTRFILERGLLPPSQFNIECKTVGQQREKMVLEILIHLKNIGSSTLIARNTRVDVRYLDAEKEPELFCDSKEPTYGRLYFTHSLREDLEHHPNFPTSTPTQPLDAGNVPDEDARETGENRGIRLLRYDTFIQAGVEQLYTFVTALPKSTTFVLIWASFEYAQKPSPFQQRVLTLSRGLGLLHYSLTHVLNPHTAERVFKVALDES